MLVRSVIYRKNGWGFNFIRPFHNVETKKMSPAKAPIVSGFFVVQPEISTPAALPFDHAFPLPVFHPAEAALTGQAKKPRC